MTYSSYLPAGRTVMAAQGQLFAGRTVCGYCNRELVEGELGYECPRCAPMLRDLGKGLAWPDLLAAYAKFQREAVAS